MSAVSYRILIVEDDQVIASAIQRHIRSWGWEARCAADFQNVMPEFVAFNPQLVILDIILPFYNGYHWCTEIRRVSKVPILFLSSASDNMNIVMAVNMGGDDFVAKPFDLDVLTAKVQAMLRRTYDFGGQVGLLEHRGAILNTADASLTYRGERIDLTKNDYKILQTLLSNKGKTVSRGHPDDQAVGDRLLCGREHPERQYHPAAQKARRRRAGGFHSNQKGPGLHRQIAQAPLNTAVSGRPQTEEFVRRRAIILFRLFGGQTGSRSNPAGTAHILWKEQWSGDNRPVF